MCGFAGEFLFAAPASGAASVGSRSRAADLSVAAHMAEVLAHRGPDESGQFLSPDGRCAIAFHRLSVIDIARSHQPMSTPDAQTSVAFNGEIYNYRHLRNLLGEEGIRFATSGDTEVLLHLYRRDGLEMLQRLDGMFAFGLYDASAGRLVLARDRLGQKPLWYAALADRIVFASEAPALLRHPGLSRQLDRLSIMYYLTMGYIPAPRSAWAGVHKLLPGHYLCVDAGPAEPVRYWEPELAAMTGSPAEQAEAVRGAVRQAVESRMVADVPLGALLSGGIDSSVVVSQMAGAAGKAGGVRTFTAGFEDHRYDERAAARKVAERFGTDHTEIIVRAAPAESLDAMVARYGEPFADSSALPTYEICKAARQHVKVALVGDGGDEVFGGYERYVAMDLAERLGPLSYGGLRLAGAICGWIAPHDERNRLRRLARFAGVLPYPPSVQYFMLRRLFSPEDLPRLLADDFTSGLEADAPAEWFCGLYEEGELPGEAAYAQRHDVLTYLPDDLLVKTDIASMACSLELRAPMLDHRLVSLGLSLPIGRKVAGRVGKVILRDAFRHELPAEVLRGPKRGFGVPLRRWLREDLYEMLRETLMDPWLHGVGIFRPEALAGLLSDHFSGKGDHSHRLWALLVLGRWLRMRGGIQ
ncbi:MAG: asparagine synthase (glutamine-hydrolyzing) [Phycisphaerae bacterium]|nr:asparagine synthase (glutamine-hydrolyzing) [Phycisphaerae bacterium]